METNTALLKEISQHLSNPDRDEGEANLSLLVAQEVGACKDRHAKSEEIRQAIRAAAAALGSAKSQAKAKAARANGAKGGRPRKAKP